MTNQTDEPGTNGYVLGKVELFHTPDSTDMLLAWIDNLPHDCRANALTAAMMCWNLCAEITKRSPPEPFTE